MRNLFIPIFCEFKGLNSFSLNAAVRVQLNLSDGRQRQSFTNCNSKKIFIPKTNFLTFFKETEASFYFELDAITIKASCSFHRPSSGRITARIDLTKKLVESGVSPCYGSQIHSPYSSGHTLLQEYVVDSLSSLHRILRAIEPFNNVSNKLRSMVCVKEWSIVIKWVRVISASLASCFPHTVLILMFISPHVDYDFS